MSRSPTAKSQAEAPQPQPELREPRLSDPGLTDLSKRDFVAIVKRAGREALDDNITDAAAALAYYAFLALPATLLLVLGLFGLFADPSAVTSLMERFGTVAPEETVTLLEGSLDRLVRNEGGSIAILSIGAVLALWTATGAMTSLMRALNRAYDRDETRGFVRQRATAVWMLAFAFLAFALVFGLLVLGPYLSEWIGETVGLESLVGWVWWAAQWPILIVALLAVFTTMLALGPNVDHPRWQFLTPGAVLAVVIWLAASGLFAVYVSMFGSYNKTWGALGAVVIMLTWLWLSALALLFAAEVNAEAERSRELRRGEPAERELQAPTKA
jgi:membrane protein